MEEVVTRITNLLTGENLCDRENELLSLMRYIIDIGGVEYTFPNKSKHFSYRHNTISVIAASLGVGIWYDKYFRVARDINIFVPEPSREVKFIFLFGNQVILYTNHYDNGSWVECLPYNYFTISDAVATEALSMNPPLIPDFSNKCITHVKSDAYPLSTSENIVIVKAKGMKSARQTNTQEP